MCSKVTETEDVSYVSSPYLPKCLRAPDAAPRKPAFRRVGAAWTPPPVDRPQKTTGMPRRER